MANLSRTMRRLQQALIQQGIMVKLGSRQFYSDERSRMVTVHTISLPKWSEKSRKMVDREILSTSSKAEVVRYLAQMLEELKREA